MAQPLIVLKPQRLDRLHSEVMALIGEVSCYGSKQGQGALAAYGDDVASFYHLQMRRLSTRLYQLAALLMLQRAERDGDMKREDVARESAKIVLEYALPEADNPLWNEVDADFCRLNQKSLELARQVQNLLGAVRHQGKNMPHQQLRRLEAAFHLSSSARQGERL